MGRLFKRRYGIVGPKKKSSPEVVYVPNPQTQQQLQQTQQQVQQVQQQVKQINTENQQAKQPAKWEDNFNEFLEKIRRAPDQFYTLSIPKKQGVKCVGVFGKISVGKTLLLNVMFGLSKPVGLGKTTHMPERVYSNNTLQVFDTPGSVSFSWFFF